MTIFVKRSQMNQNMTWQSHLKTQILFKKSIWLAMLSRAMDSLDLVQTASLPRKVDQALNKTIQLPCSMLITLAITGSTWMVQLQLTAQLTTKDKTVMHQRSITTMAAFRRTWCILQSTWRRNFLKKKKNRNLDLRQWTLSKQITKIRTSFSSVISHSMATTNLSLPVPSKTHSLRIKLEVAKKSSTDAILREDSNRREQVRIQRVLIDRSLLRGLTCVTKALYPIAHRWVNWVKLTSMVIILTKAQLSLANGP